MRSKLVWFITHLFMLGVGLAIGVFGNLLTPWVQNEFFGAPYQYDALVPTCGSASPGWVFEQAQAVCGSQAMTLSVTSSPATGEAVFEDPNHAFPANYRVSVTIDNISDGSCAGLVARGHVAQATGYAVFICARGVWEISRFDPSASKPVLLSTGVLPTSSQHNYTVAFITRGNVYQLQINGVLVGGNNENLYPNTEDMALIVSPSGTAEFSYFDISEIR